MAGKRESVMKFGTKKDADKMHEEAYIKFLNQVFRKFQLPLISSVQDFETGIPFLLFMQHGCKAKPRKYNQTGADKNAMVQKSNHSIAMKMYDEVLEREKGKNRLLPPRMVKEENLSNTNDSRMVTPVLGALFVMIKISATLDIIGDGRLEDLLLQWYRGQVDAYGQGGRPTNWGSDLRHAEIWNALHHSCTDGNPGNWDRWAQEGNEAEQLDQTFAAFEKDMGVEQLFSGEDVMTGRTDKELFVTYISSIRMEQRLKMQQDYVRRAKALLASFEKSVADFMTSGAGTPEQMVYDHINQLKRVEGNYQEVETKDLAFLFHEIKVDNPAWKCDKAILPSALMGAYMDFRKAKDDYWEKIASGLTLTNAMSTLEAK